MVNTIIGLICIEALLMVSALISAFWTGMRPSEASLSYHMGLGIGAAVLACLIHCISMFYFVGTRKDMRSLIRENHLDPSPLERNRRNLIRVHTFATLSCVLIVMGAALGGPTERGIVSPIVHSLVIYIALAWNGVTFQTEIKALTENGRLIRAINHTIEKLATA